MSLSDAKRFEANHKIIVVCLIQLHVGYNTMCLARCKMFIGQHKCNIDV